MIAQGSPRRLGRYSAGVRRFAGGQSTRRSGSVKTLAEVALDFTVDVLDAERRLIAAGWRDPVAFHDAAVAHGLCGDRYGDSDLGFLHSFLCACAEHGVKPTARLCCAVAKGCGAHIQEPTPLSAECGTDWLSALILKTDCNPSKIDTYAEAVASLMDTRERIATERLTRFGDLVLDSDRFVFSVRERRHRTPQPARGARYDRSTPIRH